MIRSDADGRNGVETEKALSAWVQSQVLSQFCFNGILKAVTKCINELPIIAIDLNWTWVHA